MNACIEEIRVQNEHAIRCAIVCRPVSVIEYVKAVSSVIGASHILAVFEERDSIKIFLNDRRYVDTLIKSCLHIMGHHVKVDYVTPPGTRLILTEIDPIISNYDVMRLLSAYGTVVSPVIRPPVSDDTELCHIGYGVRYVYMCLANETLPETIEFKYGEHMCSFKIAVESSDVVALTNVKVDNGDDSHMDNDNSNSSVVSQDVSSPPVLVSVQSIRNNDEAPTLPLMSTPNGVHNPASVVRKRRGRPPNSAKRLRMAKTITATSKAARKIKRNVKHKWIRRRYKKIKTEGGKQVVKSISAARKTVRKPSDSSSSCGSIQPELSMLLENSKEEGNDTDVPFEHKQVLEYLIEVKNHRAPLELAKKYFGDDCNSMNKLVEQLVNFKQQLSDQSLKNRIWRLVKSLKVSLNNSSQNVSSDVGD